MKVHLYTITYNEEKILPFFFQHYEQFVDHFFVYDNKSIDGTVNECLKRDDVTVTIWDSNKKFEEFKMTELRNSIWKRSKGVADFVIVCDADEFLFSRKDLFIYTLAKMKAEHFSVLKPNGYGMVSSKFPILNSKRPITKQVKQGAKVPSLDKCVLFDPSKITESNFSLGSHFCMPEGTVKVYRDPNIMLLHYKNLGVAYSIEKNNMLRKRVPKKNFKLGISKHYFVTDEHTKKAVNKCIRSYKNVI